jgi:hypothetical protein
MGTCPGGGLTAQVRALEARKALLAGTVAALEAPGDGKRASGNR